MFTFFIYLLFFVFNIYLSNTQNVPSQVHIALAGKNNNGMVNTMAISWSTINNTQTVWVILVELAVCISNFLNFFNN